MTLSSASAWRRRPAWILATMLLFLGQVVLAPSAWFPDEASLIAGVPICHAGGNSGGGAPTDHHGTTTCDVCLLCHVIGAAAVPPAPQARVPAPRQMIVARPVRLPPSQAPPLAPLLADASKTGPPPLA